MYIDPFVAGVISTLFVEFILIFIFAIFLNTHKK